MNFFIMVSLFLSAALGVFRGIDLALLTDAETGLCSMLGLTLRSVLVDTVIESLNRRKNFIRRSGGPLL